RNRRSRSTRRETYTGPFAGIGWPPRPRPTTWSRWSVRSTERGEAMSDDLRETTRRTAARLFHTLPGGTGFELWKAFDKELARELSMFFTGTLYSREVIPQRDRELCAVAALTVLGRLPELRAHCHA